jgi:hypothetical protein
VQLKDAIYDFLTHAEVGKYQSKKTVENYRHYLKRFEKFAKPTTDVAKLSADTPAALPLSRQPSSADEPPNPAEALLANSKPQPVGTVELQGKSGDGLSGASSGGSTLGSAQKPGSAGQARSNIDTKINSGFLSASSFESCFANHQALCFYISNFTIFFDESCK